MLTLPNLLTLSRIFAVPLLAFLLWWPQWKFGYAVGFVLYCIIGFTDYLDGYLADLRVDVALGRAQGLASLWAAAALTMITGWDYLRVGLKHMD